MAIRILLSLITLTLLSTFLFAGCDQNIETKEEIDMTPKLTIPSIDTALPSEIETATFALG